MDGHHDNAGDNDHHDRDDEDHHDYDVDHKIMVMMLTCTMARMIRLRLVRTI